MTLQELIIGIILGTFWGLMIYVGFALPIEASETTQVQVKNEEKPQFSITHKWRPEDNVVQDYVRYAYKISGGDLDFVATLEAENGRRDPYRQSDVVSNGKREESYGFCQMMRKYHPEVNEKKFWEDPYYQLDVCYRKYKWGTKFYGYNVRHKVKDRFDVSGTSAKNTPVWTRKNEKVENHYIEARLAQDVADMKWSKCIEAKQCVPEL